MEHALDRKASQQSPPGSSPLRLARWRVDSKIVESAVVRFLRELKVPAVTGLIVVSVWLAAHVHRLDQQIRANATPAPTGIEFDQAEPDETETADASLDVPLEPHH
jgi:hypothetical protein